MNALPARGRIAAAIVAAVCWVGLCVQVDASTQLAGSLGVALWTMALYFTILTNLLVAAMLTLVAAGRRVPGGAWTLGGGTLSILLVGVVYATLLRGLKVLTGNALIADTFLHTLAPIFVFLWWLICAPHARLGWRDPLGWALYPLAYLGYALTRGAIEGHYPYPFIDVSRIGWTATLANALAIAAGFLIAGWLLVMIDRRLAPPTPLVGAA